LLLDKARQFETPFAPRARSSLPLRLYLLSRKSFSSIAGEYINSLEERPVFSGEKSLRAMHALVEPLPENPSDPFLSSTSNAECFSVAIEFSRPTETL
jgi:hypothetical protein